MVQISRALSPLSNDVVYTGIYVFNGTHFDFENMHDIKTILILVIYFSKIQI